MSPEPRDAATSTEHCQACGMSARGDFRGTTATLSKMTELHVKPCKVCGFKFGESQRP